MERTQSRIGHYLTLNSMAITITALKFGKKKLENAKNIILGMRMDTNREWRGITVFVMDFPIMKTRIAAISMNSAMPRPWRFTDINISFDQLKEY